MWFNTSRSISKRKKRFEFFPSALFDSIWTFFDDEKSKNLNNGNGLDCNKGVSHAIYEICELDKSLYFFPISNYLEHLEQKNSIIYGVNIDSSIYTFQTTFEDKLYIYGLLYYIKIDKNKIKDKKVLNMNDNISFNIGLFQFILDEQSETDNLKSLKLIEHKCLNEQTTLKNIVKDFSNIIYGGKLEDYYNKNYLFFINNDKLHFINWSDYNNPYIDEFNFPTNKRKELDGFENKLYRFSHGELVLQSKYSKNTNKYFVLNQHGNKYVNSKLQNIRLQIKHWNIFQHLGGYYDYGYDIVYHKGIIDLIKSKYLDDKLKQNIDNNDVDYLKSTKTTKGVDYNNVKDLLNLTHKYFLKVSDFQKCYINITPFNNCILNYSSERYNKTLKLQKYHILCKPKFNILNEYGFYRKEYFCSKINSDASIKKYIINKKCKLKNYFYIHGLEAQKDGYFFFPIQLWKEKPSNQIYGCILNMNGKLGIFDKNIITINNFYY